MITKNNMLVTEETKREEERNWLDVLGERQKKEEQQKCEPNQEERYDVITEETDEDIKEDTLNVPEYVRKLAHEAGIQLLKGTNREFVDLTLMERFQALNRSSKTTSDNIVVPQLRTNLPLRGCYCEGGCTEIIREAEIIIAHGKVEEEYLSLLDFENMPEGFDTKEFYVSIVTALNYDWVRFVADTKDGVVFNHLYETLFSSNITNANGVLTGVYRQYPSMRDKNGNKVDTIPELEERDHVKFKRLHDKIKEVGYNENYYSYLHIKEIANCINDIINGVVEVDPAYFMIERQPVLIVKTNKENEPDLDLVNTPHPNPFMNISNYVPVLLKASNEQYHRTYEDDIKGNISKSFRDALDKCENMLDNTDNKETGEYYLSLLHDVQDLHYIYRSSELKFSHNKPLTRELYMNMTRYWFTGVHSCCNAEDTDKLHSWNTLAYPNVGHEFVSGYGLGMYAKFAENPFAPNISDFLIYEIDKSVYEENDVEKGWTCLSNASPIRDLREDIQTAYIMSKIEFDVTRGGAFKLNSLSHVLSLIQYDNEFIALNDDTKNSIKRFIAAITLMVKEMEIFNKAMLTNYNRGLRVGELSKPNICSVNMTEFLVMFEVSKYLITRDFLGFIRMINKYPEVNSVINVYLNKVTTKGDNILINMEDYCNKVRRSVQL